MESGAEKVLPTGNLGDYACTAVLMAGTKKPRLSFSDHNIRKSSYKQTVQYKTIASYQALYPNPK
jgi:hypothetical protein